MSLNLPQSITSSNKQKGSALVLAIFIMVVTTLLGTVLVRMISANAETIAYEVIGTRAYQAAQAGSQRKLSEIFPLSASPECSLGSLYDSFSTVKGLENCVATDVDCVLDATVDDIAYYTITSTGQCEIGDVFTSRTIEIKARRLE